MRSKSRACSVTPLPSIVCASAIAIQLRHRSALLRPRCIPRQPRQRARAAAAMETQRVEGRRRRGERQQPAAGDGAAPEEPRIGAAKERLDGELVVPGRAWRQHVLEHEDQEVLQQRTASIYPERADAARAPPPMKPRRSSSDAAPAAADCAMRSTAAGGPCQRSRPSPWANRNPVYEVAMIATDGRDREPARRA